MSLFMARCNMGSAQLPLGQGRGCVFSKAWMPNHLSLFATLGCRMSKLRRGQGHFAKFGAMQGEPDSIENSVQVKAQ